MSYCLNPNCPQPQNPDNNKFCQTCGTKLLLAGQYRALDLIGQGGFGRTLLAEDEYKPSQPRCVIKQLYQQQQNNPQKAAELFHSEAVRLEQLGKHPQIPELLAHFEQDNYQYLVQEYIDGQNLAQELTQKGAFREAEIRTLLNDLLPVLQFIHNGRVIHRDIKPENIIRRRIPVQSRAPLDGKGELVLVDFGAAKYATPAALAKTGTTIGSPGYAAPEQTFGKAIFASDIYSLGLTCIHLLTNVAPFDLYDVHEGAFAWRRYLLKNPVSQKLGRILDKMIQNTLKERFQSADEVMQALQSAKTDSYLANRSKAGIRSTAKKVKPKTTISLFTTLKGHSAEVYSLAFSPNKKILASGSQDKTIKLWHPTMGWEIRTLGGWFSRHSETVCSVCFSPDGKILASGSADKTAKLWDVRTGQEIITLKGHSGEVHAVAFHRDGKILASGSRDGTIKLWDVALAKEKYTLTGHSHSVHSVVFSPDGGILASASYDSTIKLWDMATGRENVTFRNSVPLFCLAFSPKGDILVSGNYETTIQLWDITTAKEIAALTSHTEPISALAFSPDGVILASGSRDKTIKLWDVSTRKEKYTLKSSFGEVCSVAFSPNGRIMASGSADATIQIWRVVG